MTEPPGTNFCSQRRELCSAPVRARGRENARWASAIRRCAGWPGPVVSADVFGGEVLRQLLADFLDANSCAPDGGLQHLVVGDQHAHRLARRLQQRRQAGGFRLEQLRVTGALRMPPQAGDRQSAPRTVPGAFCRATSPISRASWRSAISVFMACASAAGSGSTTNPDSPCFTSSSRLAGIFADDHRLVAEHRFDRDVAEVLFLGHEQNAERIGVQVQQLRVTDKAQETDSRIAARPACATQASSSPVPAISNGISALTCCMARNAKSTRFQRCSRPGSRK